MGADTSLIKTPHTKVAYNQKQLEEFAKCSNPITGPEYFLRNFYVIQHPVKGRQHFDPFDYQIDLINNYNNYRFGINMLGRQMGKTTVAAGYLLWYAMFHPDSTILVAAHKGSGAAEIMKMIRFAYELCPDHIRAGATEYNKGSVSFDNGSRIVSQNTTETTGRGMALTLIYLDEFAFVQPNIAKEFWTSLSPTLATGGKCIITSTPNSDEDTFATIWKGARDVFDEHGNTLPGDVGKNGFKAYLATWDKRPDRPDTFEAEQRQQLGDEKFEREHLCRFIIFEETLINPMFLANMEGIDPLFKMGEVRWYKRPSPEKIYVLSLDPAVGTGGDNASIQVVELPTMIQVAEWSHNKTPVEGQLKVMKDIMKFMSQEYRVFQMYWSVENNTVGEAALTVIRETGEESFLGEFITEPKSTRRGGSKSKGFHTSHKTKIEACTIMKRNIEQSKIQIKSKPLISELKNFVARGNTYAAKPGCTDDSVMSMVLNTRMIQYIATFEEDVYDAMTSSLTAQEYEDEYDAPLPYAIV